MRIFLTELLPFSFYSIQKRLHLLWVCFDIHTQRRHILWQHKTLDIHRPASGVFLGKLLGIQKSNSQLFK
ncbi:MAG: hypothetical protein BGO63_03185 [Candidatus Accumulibacter sp. 66-26]|nr:MAG: hypothetical protein BGO63_03185 [Candidatus Accumulibacter sp. 66-26]